MSILLEALRKTERNQKKQQVPTIYSDEQDRPGPDPLKSGPLIVMIAVALIISGWFTWRQYQLPEGLYQPPVILSPAAVPTGSDRISTEKAQVAQAKPDSKSSAAPAQPPTDTAAATRQQRTPVETYQAPVASTPAPAPAQTDSSPKRGFGSGQAGPSTSASSRPANQQPAGGFSQSGRSATSQADDTATVVEQDKPHIPEPIGYWELPDAIRAEVPEIRFSVLVYDNDPARRFVLVDGQRLGEGDSAQPGLVVQEIRRDGVIFSYRLYKFLVKR